MTTPEDPGQGVTPDIHQEAELRLKTTSETVRAYARDRKQRLLDDADHLLLVLRGGMPVAALNSADLNSLLHAAGAAAAGYGADAMAVVVEGVFPMIGINPITGKAWQRGEAEQLWREGEGVERGWVSETQIIAVALGTGETTGVGMPFRLVDGSVVWGDAPLALPSTGLAEAIATRMRGPVADASRVPDPADRLVGDPEHGPFLDADHGRVALDIGCTRILANRLIGHGEACLIVGSAGEADRLISEGLPGWQVEVSALAIAED